MSAYFFLVITIFWILKPLKKSLFLRFYSERGLEWTWAGLTLDGPQAELMAKVLNLIVAVSATAAFVFLTRRYRRQGLTYAFGAAFCLAFFGLYGVIDHPSEGVVWAFYLFGDLFNMVMVAAFFAYLNDLVSPRLAQRIYAFVVLGGVVGGVFGSTVVKAYISEVAVSQWLGVCSALTLGIMALAFAVSRLKLPDTSHALEESPVVVAAGMRVGIAGARVVVGSPYLCAIAGIVGIYEIVSTVMDFQFSATISYYLRGPAIGEQLASVFLVTNIVSLAVQLLLTRFVMQELGIRAALSVLPFVVLVVAGGFAVMPLLWVGSSMSIADNALNYSMNQSAKESLYVPTGAREKYQAKAFIDIFVQRAAKAFGVVLSLAMSMWIHGDLTAVRWLSLLVGVLAVVWLIVARYAGSHFDKAASVPASDAYAE